MVRGRKFSRRTSLCPTSVRRIAWPSGALRFRVTLFLLRLTDMKYVDSPPAKGGQLRVSAPFPGSSILRTSAPMSPSSIEQKGPARTRVRPRTRTPASGWSARAPCFALPDSCGEAPGDRVDAVAGAAGASPEQAGAVQCAEVGEVVDVVHRFDRDGRADPQPARLRAVADELGAALEENQRDVKRRPEPRGRRVQRGERDDLARALELDGRHLDRIARAVGGGRRHGEPTRRTARALDRLDHAASSRVTQLFVAIPPTHCASAMRASNCRPSARPVSCHAHSTICARPVAASGWPRALRPPEGLTGRRPSSAVSPSSVAAPAFPGGKSPVSSREISSNGANASGISATSIRAGSKPAIANAAAAAAWGARKLVSTSRCRIASTSVPCPMPATRTLVRSAVNTTAAAPSEIGQQWNSRSGSATMRLPRTASRVISSRKCANGFRAPCAWFFTATCAISRSPTPWRLISARVTSAAKAGIVVPYERSYGSIERPISSDTFGVGRCVIFPPPPTRTVRPSPAATWAKPE